MTRRVLWHSDALAVSHKIFHHFNLHIRKALLVPDVISKVGTFQRYRKQLLDSYRLCRHYPKKSNILRRICSSEQCPEPRTLSLHYEIAPVTLGNNLTAHWLPSYCVSLSEVSPEYARLNPSTLCLRSFLTKSTYVISELIRTTPVSSSTTVGAGAGNHLMLTGALATVPGRRPPRILTSSMGRTLFMNGMRPAMSRRRQCS